MPFLAALAPVFTAIAAIGSTAAAGVSIGETLAHGGGGGQQPQAKSPTSPATPTTATTPEKAAIAQKFPDIQSQVGGALAPDYYIHEAATESGFGGDNNIGQQAWQQWLGSGGSGSGLLPSGGSGGSSFTNSTNLVPDVNAGSGTPGSGERAISPSFWDSIKPTISDQSGDLQASGGYS